jgi:hypothetical protein
MLRNPGIGFYNNASSKSHVTKAKAVRLIKRVNMHLTQHNLIAV